MNDKIYLKIQPKQCIENIILQHLQTNGICVIKDFFPIHFINLLKKESLRLLHSFAHKIDILDKEDCSKDERLFDAQEL